MTSLLEDALSKMNAPMRERFLQHLDGGSSANWLSDWTIRFGTPISATTLKSYRAERRKENR